LARRRVIGIGQPRPEHAHVRVDRLIGEVNGTVVVLIGITRVKEKSVYEVMERDVFLEFSGGIAIRTVPLSPQPDHVPRYEVFNHMTATVIKFTRINAV